MSQVVINSYWFAAAGPDGTQNYVAVTIQSSQVPSALTDFPVYVDLSDLPAAFFTNVQTDGGDIRVTEDDGTTRAPVDLVSIDTGGSTGELHFKASSVSASSNTTYRIYYNASTTLSQPAVTDTYGRNAVWSDYAAVLHLAEDPSGTAPQMVDSTGTQDMTSAGSMTSADLVAAKLGDGLHFDGGDDYLERSNNPLTGQSALTLQAWVNPDSFSSQNNFINDRDEEGGVNFAALLRSNADGPFLAAFHDGTNESKPSGGTVSTGTWTHVAATHGATNDILYINGTAVDTVSAVGALRANSAPLLIASMIDGEGAATNLMDGLMDEVRVRQFELSADWLAAEYTNQNTPTTFYSVGTEQAA